MPTLIQGPSFRSEMVSMDDMSTEQQETDQCAATLQHNLNIIKTLKSTYMYTYLYTWC
jgi:hypothetical protein